MSEMPREAVDNRGSARAPLVAATHMAPAIWGGRVPLRNLNFTGRAEVLEKIYSALNSGTGSPVLLCALRGMTGIGKTQIAAEYAYRHKTEYDVVWWISADQVKLISSSIAGLARHLNLGIGLSDELAAPSVLDALRRGEPYSRWLLIFDNAKEPEPYLKFLLDGPGHTIVTSLNPSWAAHAQTVSVGVFSRAESLEFLSRRVPGIRADESGDLAEALGDLPLALEQAGALQSDTAMAVKDYLAEFKEKADRLLRQAKPAEYPLPVTAAWSVSISALKETVPNAVLLLRLCACFGPDPFPRNALSEGRDAVRPELGSILSDPIALNDAITGLSSYSLASVNTPARTLQVHRVVQALVRASLTAGECVQFRDDAHLLMAKAALGNPDDRRTWPRYRELAPHFMPAGIASSRLRLVRHLLRCTVRYYYLIGNYDASLELGQLALTEWAEDPETDPRTIIGLKRHVGNTLRAMGRYQEAFSLNEGAISEAAEKLGPEDPDTLRLINSHGADLRASGDFAGAYSSDEDSVRRHQKAFQEEDRRTLRALNNFALDLELAGDYVGACQMHEDVYRRAGSVYPSEDHPSILITLTNLARVVRLSGKYVAAQSMSADTYALCSKALGDSHPISLHAMTELVVAHRRAQGGTDAAVTSARDLLKQYRSLRDERHPRTLAACMALANVLREAGAVDEAIELSERALVVFPDVYGASHPFTHASRGNLALLRRLNGEHELALAIHRAALAGLEAALGPKHCLTLACSVGLASDLAALDDAGAAALRGQAALIGLQEVLGHSHPITLACAVNLAADMTSLDKHDEANNIGADAKKRFSETLGANHPILLAAIAGQRLDCDFDTSPT
jgi:tetratricopeptide (TPR) repeat protein